LPTDIGIGFSQFPNPPEATLQACVQVKNQLDASDTDLIIIFASPEYIVPEIQPIITRTLKPKHVLGSSTGGIILANGVADRGIAIMGINSSVMRFGISAIPDVGILDMHLTGFELARKAIQDLDSPTRKIFITFSEGVEKNCSPFIRGLNEALGKGFPIVGAISSDDFKYVKLFQIFQDQLLQNSAVGLLLDGPFHFALGCRHGFKPLGKPRTITKVDDYIIRTIDDQPAVEIYKHFLGSAAEGLKNITLNSTAAMYPLGIYLEEAGQYLLRNIIDILEDGSIVCQEGVPQGAEVHLMISNIESCRNSAIEAAELVKTSLADRQAKLILVFESLARHKILRRSALNEIQAIKDVLGNNIPIIGMCSFGEFGPFGAMDNLKNTYLHNESILIVALS